MTIGLMFRFVTLRGELGLDAREELDAVGWVSVG
jgi:hypothetical protein